MLKIGDRVIVHWPPSRGREARDRVGVLTEIGRARKGRAQRCHVEAPACSPGQIDFLNVALEWVSAAEDSNASPAELSGAACVVMPRKSTHTRAATAQDPPADDPAGGAAMPSKASKVQTCPTCGATNRRPLTPREIFEAQLKDQWPAIDTELVRSTAHRGGYELAAMDLLRLYLAKDFATLEAAAEKWRPAIERYDAMERDRAHSAALNQDTSTLTTQQKAARTRRMNRTVRDQAQAAEFAALVRGGETTESARQKMGIGVLRAKRLRSIAVNLKWIRPRQRKAGDPIP